MKTTLAVENIKCGGCSKSIQSKLERIVSAVEVDIEKGEVSFAHDEEAKISEVKSALERMGYPALGQSKLSHKAKSYVSCMIGRMK